MRLKLSRTLADFAVIFKAYRSLGYPYVKYVKSWGVHILTVEPTTPLLRKTGCIPCWYCGFTVISSPCALFLVFITVTTTYNPCPNFGCYMLCLIDGLALSPTLYADRKGALFLLYLPDRILSLQCLLTFYNCKNLYKTTSKQSLVYDQNFYWGTK